MLTENDIVRLLKDYLDKNGYKVQQALTTTEKGIDIIAVNLQTSERLYIEAKGETSSKDTSNRFGKPFTNNQIKNHIAKAILASIKVLASNISDKNVRVAIALPLTKGHQKEIETIKNILTSWGIKIYLVDIEKTIELK
jgi:hypothetical protein